MAKRPPEPDRPKLRTYAEVVQRVLVDAHPMTAYRLAKATGLSQVTLSDLIHGRRTPNAETLRKILFAGGKSWGWLDEVFEPADVQAPAPKAKAKK